jgi:prepilin-type processing-associated H-X9-DG protein
MDSIYPYIKSTQVFTCPSDTSTATKTYEPLDFTTMTRAGSGNTYGSYGYNNSHWSYGSAANAALFYLPLSHQSTIPEPAGTILSADVNAAAAAASDSIEWTNWDSVVTVNNNASPPNAANVEARHLETANALFCDGHVKAMKLDAMFTTKVSPVSMTNFSGPKNTYYLWTKLIEP